MTGIASLPSPYRWLAQEPGPRILLQALKLYGVKEMPGAGDNPAILAWADEIGGWLGGFYEDDEVPWCGLFVGICALRSGHPFTQKALGAKEWANWGKQAVDPMLGDVLVFTRKGGGHVGFYVGEDAEAYHVLGGNQSDEVNITRIGKDRLYAARRTMFTKGLPVNVRKVFLRPSGGLSQNEA